MSTRTRYSLKSHNLWCAANPGGKWAISCGDGNHADGCADAFRATFERVESLTGFSDVGTPTHQLSAETPKRTRKRKDVATTDLSDEALFAAIAEADRAVLEANIRLAILRRDVKRRSDALAEKALAFAQYMPAEVTP